MAAPLVVYQRLAFRFIGPETYRRKYRNLIFASVIQNCASSSGVRVRFAPSPTGFLHLGGLRTALYNYLFARSQNGSFVLRIEDTDRSRAVPGAVEKLQETLRWAEIEPDEGPAGGVYGPYIQSERLHIYHSNVKTLLRNGWAYPCFCTARRLELMKKEAARRGEPSKYDNRCRSLSQEKVQELMSKGTPYVIRLKLEPTPDPWDDMIKGPTSHNIADIEGDPILLKSDGFPTYHFANVVDDHFMGITHVLRGAEWLSSTPKHILLYKAFGWTPPKFGHLPLIVNPDGSKLSKRQDDVHVEHFRSAGYFPQAVLNYITSIGGGFGQRTQTMDLEEMCRTFNVEDVRRNAGRLDPSWLAVANRNILQERLDSNIPQVRTQLVQAVRDLVMETFGDRMCPGLLRDQILGEEYILGVVRWSLIDDRTTVLKDLVSPELSYLWVTPNPSTFDQLAEMGVEVASVLSLCLAWVKQREDFGMEALGVELKTFMKENKIKAKSFFPVIRMALTGLQQGAPLAEMISVIGRDSVILRLSTALSRLTSDRPSTDV
ncbi:probable glutamate--tRNA ligase, mitochondrial [Aplysia californica]|uniref:Nondiscriminating glutamyl-tRNA synthetase EARS2, mitochondrial n=1 Tax=Aplysia californica TaxID=6500 RepID=A0ABM0JTY4_APLCA|nr:probable glutamate--tRNA ligase, mitochondrial [Aplysia californica]